MDVDALARQFEELRPHLLSVGYRLTGSIFDAEDAVQDAWLRLDRNGSDGIADGSEWGGAAKSSICSGIGRRRCWPGW